MDGDSGMAGRFDGMNRMAEELVNFQNFIISIMLHRQLHLRFRR